MKPFTICTSDGYILSMMGPYMAKNNDGAILREILDSGSDPRNWIREGDCFILDRSFRDALSLLEHLNVSSRTP